MKGEKRSSIENHYREMAARGILMINRDQCKQFEEGVLRMFYRNIGEREV